LWSTNDYNIKDSKVEAGGYIKEIVAFSLIFVFVIFISLPIILSNIKKKPKDQE